MGKVRTVKCPLCGWSKRYGEDDFEIDRIFDGSPEDDVILVQEVGGKVKGTGRGSDEGRGKAKGRVEVLERQSLEDLNDAIKRKILGKIEEIEEKI